MSVTVIRDEVVTVIVAEARSVRSFFEAGFVVKDDEDDVDDVDDERDDVISI